MTLEEILTPLAQRVQFLPPKPFSKRAKTPSKQKPDKVFVRLTSASDGVQDASLAFDGPPKRRKPIVRSEEHTSELQSLMRISYAVFCLKKKNKRTPQHITTDTEERRTISR